MGGRGWLRIVALIIVGSLALSAGASAQATRPVPARAGAVRPGTSCQLDIGGSGRVATVRDGRSFVLDDGREVRLAGIEAPMPPASGDGAEAQAATAAKAALESLILGATVELRWRTPATDRYGRILAYVTLPDLVEPSLAEPSVAHALLGRGLARVAASLDDAACAADLLSRERMARAQKLGLWGEADYAILGAESGADLLGRQGHFAVVEGKVLSVRESGGTIYMNFGRRWSQSLTVTVLKRHERTFAAAGLQPDRLVNLRLRVRGFIEERSGPRIEATRPEQIEIAEGR
jgi:endonuclease YncB( thermonuclease family)